MREAQRQAPYLWDAGMFQITLIGRRCTYSYVPRQCGGFLADRWLGAAEPDLYGGDLTPSQRKVFKLNPCLLLAHIDIFSTVLGHDSQGLG
jgi:hypothetical protein